MKTLFVIECSAGEYDDYHWWIEGIFTNEIVAKDLCKKLNVEKEAEKLIPNPFKDIENLTEEEDAKYHEWWLMNDKANEWVEAKVVEYPVNELIKR